MVAQSLSGSGTPTEGVRRPKAEMEAEAAASVLPVKRRRGRPRKSDAAATPGGESGGDATTPQKRHRKKKGEAVVPTAVDVSLIGQQVTGILDGTFDAGYLLSVRVGSTDTVLRGVVFGPGLSVPISKVNDVAPNVKQVRREERMIPHPPKPVAIMPLPPFVSTQPVQQLLGVIPPTSAVLEAAAAVFTNPVSAATSPLPTTGLTAALQQLPGGGYSPEPSTFSRTGYQSEAVQQLHVNVQSGA